MNKYLYTCQYCSKEYKPNRRYKQRFCSNSCRVNSFNRNKLKVPIIKSNVENETKQPLKIDAMSFAGVGNAAAGSLAVQLATNFLTPKENKPATKGDLQNLTKTLQQRYHPVFNMPLRHDGAKPFYDIETQTIVYKLIY